MGEFTAVMGSQGSEVGQFYHPRAICVDNDGHLLIADDNKRIQFFTTKGEFLRHINTNVIYPCGLVLGLTGQIVLSETDSSHIQIFDTEGGTLIRKIGARGTSPGQFQSPCGLVVDKNGDVAVTDHGNARVQIFSSEGLFLRELGGPGIMNGPVDLILDVEGNLIVIENGTDRIQVWG